MERPRRSGHRLIPPQNAGFGRKDFNRPRTWHPRGATMPIAFTREFLHWDLVSLQFLGGDWFAVEMMPEMDLIPSSGLRCGAQGSG